MVVTVVKDAAKKYFWNLLIAVDQLVNTIFGGDPDETISSRLGKEVVRHPNNKFASTLCWFLSKIDPDHCKKSIEDDEGDDEVVHL